MRNGKKKILHTIFSERKAGTRRWIKSTGAKKESRLKQVYWKIWASGWQRNRQRSSESSRGQQTVWDWYVQIKVFVLSSHIYLSLNQANMKLLIHFIIGHWLYCITFSVSSELKKDKRTIEETLADIRAKKLKKGQNEVEEATEKTKTEIEKAE